MSDGDVHFNGLNECASPHTGRLKGCVPFVLSADMISSSINKSIDRELVNSIKRIDQIKQSDWLLAVI